MGLGENLVQKINSKCHLKCHFLNYSGTLEFKNCYSFFKKSITVVILKFKYLIKIT